MHIRGAIRQSSEEEQLNIQTTNKLRLSQEIRNRRSQTAGQTIWRN